MQKCVVKNQCVRLRIQAFASNLTVIRPEYRD